MTRPNTHISLHLSLILSQLCNHVSITHIEREGGEERERERERDREGGLKERSKKCTSRKLHLLYILSYITFDFYEFMSEEIYPSECTSHLVIKCRIFIQIFLPGNLHHTLSL